MYINQPLSLPLMTNKNKLFMNSKSLSTNWKMKKYYILLNSSLNYWNLMII